MSCPLLHWWYHSSLTTCFYRHLIHQESNTSLRQIQTSNAKTLIFVKIYGSGKTSRVVQYHINEIFPSINSPQRILSPPMTMNCMAPSFIINILVASSHDLNRKFHVSSVVASASSSHPQSYYLYTVALFVHVWSKHPIHLTKVFSLIRW